MLELSSDMTSLGHVRAAYEYLTEVDEKHKVIIDFLHKLCYNLCCCLQVIVYKITYRNLKMEVMI